MIQPALFDIPGEDVTLVRTVFSHEGAACDQARMELESKYSHLLHQTKRFSRQLVSFQANKTEQMHRWSKYREGFSASLVEILLHELNIRPGDVVLDPFAGSATTLLVASMSGLNAVGIELLPYCHLAWRAKSLAYQYDIKELKAIVSKVKEVEPPPVTSKFPHITITETAFPEQIELSLMSYKEWFQSISMSEESRVFCEFSLVSILEEVSYTRKDGQFLRWDSRATKIMAQNEKRVAQGKQPYRGIYKGTLPSVHEALIRQMERMVRDISDLQKKRLSPGEQRLIEGSTLQELPLMSDNQFAGVITSPPYANRYDYTRTYALELAYLGVGEDIFNLRQQLLSCTVENKSKTENLSNYYDALGLSHRYQNIMKLVAGNAALQEINDAMRLRQERGEINNKGVLTLIEQYFTELAFVFAELYRVCKSGAYVAFVNDNVRYAGEIIPVDMLCTELAESVGFAPTRVYVLPQRKGNSSQQMGKYGREALRKSITIWQKP